ncbi:GIY-YIG nuclease family protein [candidate division FCPU426 bacterium]|nr:GIY-YIG nuclease family protein [candidate division FCPU426 bacterium]
MAWRISSLTSPADWDCRFIVNKINKNTAYTLYILRCSDNSLYTGIAKNLAQRLQAHRLGRGSKYVYPRQPFQVVYRKVCANKSLALQQEARMKKLRRDRKIALIQPRQHRQFD